MTKDPVCGMQVDETKTRTTAVYNGKTYYFCSTACQQAFEKAPKQYTT
jgi:Cu+-exporting ATPase